MIDPVKELDRQPGRLAAQVTVTLRRLQLVGN
jgi:hypothetical protein